ncbi:hypothetical protein P7K49_014127 [Saguinus oedipus]|uniref:Uncharacterized protein n=1 Tax=Saguinus oedipus TaxID=9490 RepID=A0ABQ9VHY5_SAGOE|nr:hypothetical protein P7K49_014127 [Saguinus oedipus]
MEAKAPLCNHYQSIQSKPGTWEAAMKHSGCQRYQVSPEDYESTGNQDRRWSAPRTGPSGYWDLCPTAGETTRPFIIHPSL